MQIPLSHADEALGNQIQCTKSFPLLEDGVKRRKPALVPDAVGQGLDCLPADGSLSRAAAMTHLAVEEVSRKLFIGNLPWPCTAFSGDLWDQQFLP